jgi:hypothetical protein
MIPLDPGNSFAINVYIRDVRLVREAREYIQAVRTWRDFRAFWIMIKERYTILCVDSRRCIGYGIMMFHYIAATIKLMFRR